MSLEHVICTTCGTENAAGLVFCQTCGSRLAGRVAPAPAPVPAAVPVPAPAAAAPNAYAPPADHAPRPVPVPVPNAGEARYQPRRVEHPQQGPAPAAHPAPPASQVATAMATGTIACTMCGGKNDAAQSFCLACGSKLVKPAAPIPPSRKSAPAPAYPHQAPATAYAAPQDAIAISPVRMVSQPPPAAAAQVRVCLRCRGDSDPQAQFCRFCGAPMAEAPLMSAPLPLAPAPAAPLQAPLQAPPTAQAFAPVPVSAGATGAAGAQAAQVAMSAPIVGSASVAVGPAATASPAAGHSVHDEPTKTTMDLPEQAAAGQLSRVAIAAIRGANANAPAPSTSDADPATTRTPAVKAAANEGVLLLIGRDGSVAATYPLSEQMDIGRSEGDVRIENDGYLSPRHARIVKREGKTFLRDLDSVNGVYRRIPTGPETQTAGHHVVRLRDGELFLLGQQVLKVELVNDAAESAGLGNAKERGTLLFGTPASPRYARLCQRTVEGITRDVYYVRKPETVLGRESGDVVFPEDPFLSRRHAILRFSRVSDEQVLTLADLGSSNGTFVQIRGEVPVSSGDCFRIGQQLFRVDLPSAPGGSASSSSSMRHASA